MELRKHILEGITLVALALICALTANAVAGRERKMAMTGYYPGATKVPQQSTAEPAPIAVVTGPGTTGTNGTAVTFGTTAPAPGAGAVKMTPAATLTATRTATTTATAAAPAAKPSPQSGAVAAALHTTAATQTGAALKTADDVLAKFKEHPNKPYIEIGYNDAAGLHARGILFLDARRTSVYEQGHIAGARAFSVWESDIDDKVTKLFNERPDPAQQAQPIVAYCSGGDCEDSHMLAQKLWGVQFNNVYVYKDGYPDWVAHSGSVHTGTNP